MEPIHTVQHTPMLERREEISLEEKYGQFAQDSWIDRELNFRKMDMIKSDLQEGPRLEKLRRLLSRELGILAISKDELT